MAVKFCPLCERKVEPVKKFSWPIFLILFLTIGGWLLYLLWFFIFAKRVCPICGTKNLQSVDKAIKAKAIQEA